MFNTQFSIKRIAFLVSYLFLVNSSFCQTIAQKLQTAFQQFENDPQLKHAISSLYVIDAKTSKIVFDKNSQIGLAPASTQKIITTATAFELLGKNYRYKTSFGIYDQKDETCMYIFSMGDPTFGSWRWSFTKTEVILQNIKQAFLANGIHGLERITLDDKRFDSKVIPDGWIWQDLANYYGAGSSSMNWRENQFDVVLRSGKRIGDSTEIVEINPNPIGYELKSLATSAAKGTGDNAYIYFPLGNNKGIITGTIPINENRFIISGALPSSKNEFLQVTYDSLKILFHAKAVLKKDVVNEGPSILITEHSPIIYTHSSPTLDSIIYWFLKRSINLYGEALIKTLAYEKQGFGSTDSGVVIVKNFWKQKGLDEDELNICDGSGLSPLNRVTTHSQVEVLKYAKTKDWFSYFYNALPEYNGMKMKSGTIRDVKSFCGYQTAKDGKEYIFSFIVNNYNGLSSELVNKMYKVLDILK